MFAALKQLSQLVVNALDDTTQPVGTSTQSTSINQITTGDNEFKQSVSPTTSSSPLSTSKANSPSSTASTSSVALSSTLSISSTSVSLSQSSLPQSTAEQSENGVVLDVVSSQQSVQIPKPVKPTAPTNHSPLPPEDGIPWMNQLRIRECFIYPIDPKAHDMNTLFAESFPLDKPIATGELHIFAKNDWLYVRLFDERGAIFADSVWIDCAFVNRPIPLSHYIQPVKDSSRYFALRVGEAGPKPKRVAHLLIGFRERPSAFDLIATINDRINLSQRLELTERFESDAQSEAEAEARLNETHTDMSLRGSIHVKLHLKDTSHGDACSPSHSDVQHKRVTSIAVIQSDQGMMLAPPPEASHNEHDQHGEHIEQNKKKKKNRKPRSDGNDEIVTGQDGVTTGTQLLTDAPSDNEDDWGEFAGA